MTKWLGVIGVGSQFGADNVAQCVITRLQQDFDRASYNNKIVFAYYDRPGISLLEYLQPFKSVHLVDAIVSGKPIGTIHRYETIASFKKNNCLISSHNIGVAETLILGKTLGCLPDKITIHGIEIENNCSINQISNRIILACDALSTQMMNELKNEMLQFYQGACIKV